MSEYKKVKIQSIIESQIPEFLNEDYPLFKEFLQQYYISQEHQTGIVDLAKNLNQYKSISNFNIETFYGSYAPSVLISDIMSLDDVINVSHTIGFPSKYGLFKIGDEIITYQEKTETSFIGCIRGFSGISSLETPGNTQFLEFSSTNASNHFAGTPLINLNLIFFEKIFNKFRAQFIPGFENRTLYPTLNLETILTRAKDFYTTKGTDSSFKILFSVLFAEQIQVIRPKDYTLRPSDNNYFLTKNILVEKISGGDIFQLNGKSLFQTISGVGTASASVYNVEYRPVDQKDFYEISLDSTSFIYNFNTTKKTNVLENVSAGSSSIFVDSTVGFGNSGSFFAFPETGVSQIELSYTDKTINQFLNVSNLTQDLSFGDKILENNFLYSTLDDGSKIELRLLNVIDKIDYSKTSKIRPGDKISLSSFGVDLNDKIQMNSWIYNLPIKHQILSIVGPIGSNNLFKITLKNNVKFILDESLILTNTNDVNDVPVSVKVDQIISSNSIQVQSSSNISNKNILSKIITKGNSVSFPEISSLEAGVINTYSDYNFDNFYVASSGIPNYQLTATVNKVSFVSLFDNYTINTNGNHNLETGERVYFYSASSQNYFKSGKYFVQKISNTKIKLAYNQNDIFSKSYIDFSGYTFSENDYLVKDEYYDKKLEHQKLLKKFSVSKDDNLFYYDLDTSTAGRPIGLLINGIELYSSTVFNESIFYGQIDNIKVQRGGSGYDVINGPSISISDLIGSDASAIANVSGSVKDVKIISPGIGYISKPKITIEGGNGSGAVLEPNLVKESIKSSFKGNSSGVNINTDIITFISDHYFENAEQIVYTSNGNVGILCRKTTTVNNVTSYNDFNLVDNSTYFVGTVSENQIKLYTKYDDVLSGINTVDIIGISTGIHNFTTLNTKNTINKIYVKEQGSGYSNKSIRISSGINTYDHYISAANNNFYDGDVVVYSYNGTSIGGLSTTTQYIVTTIDENNFKLSESGIGTQFTRDNYVNKKYIKFTSTGDGAHTFSYPPINIKIEATPGISKTSIVSPVLEPVVLGSIESVFIENSGNSYGTPDIINFHRKPLITISTPKEASIKPVISNGSIVDIQILYSGEGYGNATDIVINGKGKYAEILPVIENGKLTSAIILNSGIGYDNNTELSVIQRGSGALFEGNVFEWKINQVVKNHSTLSLTDDFIIPSEDKTFGLKSINFYPSKKLRNQLQDNIDRNTLIEKNENKQSPILGWAYDGNPIYGSYILKNSKYEKVKSSYGDPIKIDPSLRPSGFEAGYFIQDYPFNRENGDLDEFNGRFAKTKEFPNGTYAYYVGLDYSGNPAYPYVIGNNFKYNPIKDNFNNLFNQNSNLDGIDIIRNVGPYYINSSTSEYGLIDKIDKKYKQDFIVKKIYPSKVNSVSVYSPGNNYKVQDNLVFDNTNTGGSSASAVVERIQGKTISNVQIGISTFNNTKFYNKSNTVFGNTQTPHNLINGDQVLVSSASDINFSSLNGFKTILVDEKVVGLSSDIQNATTTGITTYISVSDISGFNINDLIQIDDEILRIINISSKQSRLYVNRDQSYTGIHTSGISSVKLLPTEFKFVVDEIKSYSPKNTILYFNPYDSVGYGISGSTYTSFDGNNNFIPERRIYIPNHNFYTGQPLTYSVGVGGNGDGISVSNTGIAGTFKLQNSQTIYSVVFDKNHIGISTLGFTTSIGIGSSLKSLYFISSSNIGLAHSLSSQINSIQGKVENYSVTVTTSENHQLSNGESIKFNVFPSLTETISFKYDNILRKITSQETFFDASSFGVSVVNSEITIGENKLSTGDKIVYYSNGNAVIGGLENNQTYFVLKLNPYTIKLCRYEYDTTIGNYIQLSSASVGSHSISSINPPFNLTKGNVITFDMSDPSLINFDLILYKDKEFRKELETYLYQNHVLDTQNNSYPSEIYYKFIPKLPSIPSEVEISYDDEVKNRNQINIRPSLYNKDYSILNVDQNNFKFNLSNKPENTEYNILSGNIFYDTNSTTATGPISKVNVISNGKGYLTIPKISNVISSSGSGAILYANSDSIGKIDYLERVKDGFDYPTDKTLKSYLGVPATAQIKDIERVEYVGIVTGGRRYNVPPILKVIGNKNIELSCTVTGGTINSVSIVQNTNDLSGPLEIIPTKNSNGYDINAINVNGNYVTIELINSDSQLYPLIPDVYGQSGSTFPFEVGDQIFIERCIITDNTKSNYNSEKYGYKFFTLTSVNPIDYTITYSIEDLNVDNSFGEYTTNFGYGYAVNKKDIVQFEMFVANDLSYISNEKVIGYDESGNEVFNATVMENGWDNNINELRMIDCFGKLKDGYKLKGDVSKLNGTAIRVNQFNLESTLGTTREKINYSNDRKGMLNDYQQRISDNNYYQKFSYAIKSQVSYDKWREPVRSLVHPAGYKEFSDLDIIGITTSNMKPTVNSDLSLLVNIDNSISLQTKNNFALAIDEERGEDGSVERIQVIGANFTPYILSSTNKVILIDDISDQFTGISSSSEGDQVVGLSSFKLRNSNGVGEYPLFYREFDGSNGINTSINLNNNTFNIDNHNFQTGQNIIYSYGNGSPIGIATTSIVESSQVIQVVSGNTAYLSVASTDSNIIIKVGGGSIGSAIYENGYNIAISGPISGISSIDINHASKNVFYGYSNPFPQNYTSGIGTDAKFSVFIVYDNTGTAISTSIILNDGGRGYKVGNNVSISGTYIGGATPANDLSFVVSKIANSNISGQANQTYTNVSGITTVGLGIGASFTVSRDNFGAISSIIVSNGGVGYALTDQIIISGSNVGGSSPIDDVYLSPTLLGTKVLPKNLYVKKLDNNHFRVSGLSTTVENSLDLISLGIGTHSFTLANSNESTMIVIDNIVQNPPYYKGLYLDLSTPVGIGSTILYLQSGISSISGDNFIKIDEEYLRIISIGIGSTNAVNVERGYLGTSQKDHSTASQVSIMKGNYNIVNDVIYLSTPPYGKIPYEDASNAIGVTTTLNAKSSFQGRVFSREFDTIQAPNDNNIILDDISLQFTGVDNIIGTYNGTLNSNYPNRISGISTLSLLIGDVINLEYTNNLLIDANSTITTIGNNLIIISPNHNVSIGIATTSFIITRNNFPLLSNNQNVVGIYTNTNDTTDINNNPLIFINNIVQVSGVDFTIDTAGNNTIKFISGIPNTGKISKVAITTSYGYLPYEYTNLSLYYKNNLGVGTGAKISIKVGNASSITQFDIIDPGKAYKVGDSLGVVGITTDPSAGNNFKEFNLTVTEVFSDKFFGYYLGQFIQFDDLSQYFDGSKKRFSLTTTKDNKTSVVSLKTIPGSDLNISNNVFVFINNILQEPGVSYTFQNSKLVFSEAPKKNSTCTVLFYRGSSRDVTQIDPPLSIKEGDNVQIKKDFNHPLTKEQFERTVKRIVSVDELDTFTYDSFGIDTANYRPIDWTKQTEDKIINGVLYSKSRPGLHSKITPAAQIIKKISPSDTIIYVDNAFPIFSAVDNLSSKNNNIVIVENREISAAFGTAYVSSASTISNIDISYGGDGYQNNLSPTVKIVNNKLNRKDLVNSWNSTLGITTTSNFKSIASGNIIVSVGDDGILCNSVDGSSWNFGKNGTTNLNSIDVGGPIGTENSFEYISVGDYANIIKSSGIGTTISSWTQCSLYDQQNANFEIIYTPTSYTNNLNSISYSPSNNSWVSVGNSGGIFYGAGITTTVFLNYSLGSDDFNSVANKLNKFVIVGNSGVIFYSIDGRIWNRALTNTSNNFTSNNLHKVIWTGDKFIAVGNNTTILTSLTGESDWETINVLNISTNFVNIKYYDNIYYATSDLGVIYQSSDLSFWLPVNTNQSEQIIDLLYTSSISDDGITIAVGYSGTTIYSTPEYHYPIFNANVIDGSVSSIDIIDGGFGYQENIEIPFFIESDAATSEEIYTVRSKGDFGNITKISVASSTIDFTLRTQSYDNITLGVGYSSLNSYSINYSGLSVGDYFVITESNSICGHALTGITTSLGGMSNYPTSRVGTATSFIDGVYRVERVTKDTISGIVTVGCNFTPGPSGYPINVTVGINSFGFYGKYSWGLFYNYQNRENNNPKTFEVNTNNGLVGISTAPVVFRTRGLI